MSIPSTIREFYFPKFGSYTNLVLREKPYQASNLKANEVLIKNHAVSLNYRDLLVAAGAFGTSDPNAKIDIVPCSDMAGEIVQVGDLVTEWKVGDRVMPAVFGLQYGVPHPELSHTVLGGFVDGTLTDYKAIAASDLFKIPDHLSYEEGAAIVCAAVTVYNSLTASRPIRAGDWLLVQGTGGVSISGLQLGIAMGARVIVTSSSDEKLKIAQKLGAKPEYCINYNTTPDWDEEVMRITEGKGVDHTLEVIGGPTLAKTIASSASGACIHIIGLVGGLEPATNVILDSVRKSLTFRGIEVGSLQQFHEVIKILVAHPETTRPYIDKVFKFEDSIEAYNLLESQKHVGKVVIKF